MISKQLIQKDLERSGSEIFSRKLPGVSEEYYEKVLVKIDHFRPEI
jgi:hypothetical protein